MCKSLKAVVEQLGGMVKNKHLILQHRAIMRIKWDYIYNWSSLFTDPILANSPTSKTYL